MFLNIYTISLSSARITSHSAYISVSEATGDLGDNACHRGRLQHTSIVSAYDIFSLLKKNFCGAELLIASLIQTQKTNSKWVYTAIF